jgi:hypothetical protein
MTWMVDSTGLLLIVMISVSVGFFIGVIILLLRSNAENRPPKKGLEDAGRLWRDRKRGDLWLQFGDETGNNLESFAPTNRVQIQASLRELSTWINPLPDHRVAGSTPVSGTAPGEEAESVSTPVITHTQTDLEAVELPVETNSPGKEARPPLAAFPSPAAKPRIDLIKGLQLSIEGDAARNLSGASIAAQVDEILQKKVAGTPLEARGIRLMELPGKGMVVMVGMEQYETVDDVPYPEIKVLLKFCVAEWEKSVFG